jgi:hypothetical protein
VDHLALEPDQNGHGVLVGSAPDFLGLCFGPGDDPAALLFGRLGQPTLVDEEGRLLLGTGDDPLRFLLGLVDDALTLGVDPLGRANLLGYGDTELIDEPEGGVLVDDYVVGQRQLLAVGDQRLEALDQEDDVDRSGLRERGLGWRGLSHAAEGPRAGRPATTCCGVCVPCMRRGLQPGVGALIVVIHAWVSCKSRPLGHETRMAGDVTLRSRQGVFHPSPRAAEFADQLSRAYVTTTG